MTSPTIFAIAVIATVIVGITGYLLARSRSATRIVEHAAARSAAEERNGETRRQVEELRSERDRASERADRLEHANGELTATRHDLDRRLGQLSSELASTRSELQQKEAATQRLRVQLEASDAAGNERERNLREAEQQLATLRAREEGLTEQIHDLRRNLAELAAKNQALQEEAAALEAVRQQVDASSAENLRLQKESFEALGAKLLAQSQEALVTTAESKLREMSKPVHESLAQLGKQLREFDTSRTTGEASLRQEIKGLSEENIRSRRQTQSLVEALKRPQTRGQWGEMQLRRAAELAGMLDRCDFDLQVHIPGEDASHRPDMVVHLAGGKHAIVDSKVPMQAFVAATEATDEAEAKKLWADHSRHVRRHVDDLAGKQYFRKMGNVPEFVIMFVPSESFLQPALEYDAALLEYAAAKQVLITTPVTLIAALRSIAFGWKQEALRENMQQVLELGTEIYDRLSTMGGHMDKLGAAIDRSVKAYNATAGCLESRVMVTARKFKDLKLVEKNLPQFSPKDTLTRPLGSPELIESAAAERLGDE
ncbi:DNA recombination protein RmuC [Nocardia terpenica]|uniref:DNA recombination protein RmuC n=1 Tax=Nocardia terpenica TaxID=455432 RepID=UPI001895FEED|nr:DNA recombination protein RmuC [Nocardia terpenica]MBF6060457.1 DNA recombination protein RmuC [Nocardia terpenica]MBF6103717.1 DNA recombination protein RmuC [Nocardia terpenica]MBF6111909.1 DNA recombination protein RmuC [Nocardia terpenica]MBF6117938.1 DNA recombination protein RmuC [Nocardia terpenica]MBF6155336.1 DNA recombination protein RmuC [Nocardia terpenica]